MEREEYSDDSTFTSVIIISCIILIIILFVSTKQDGFYPQLKHCSKTDKSNSSDSQIGNIDCLIPGYVNPVTLINSNKLEHLLYNGHEDSKSQIPDLTYKIWPGERGFMIVDNETGPTYDPSCINTGICKITCQKKESFESERRANETRLFPSRSDVIYDVRFPPKMGGMIGDANIAGPFHAGGITLGGYAETTFAPSGYFNTDYVEAIKDLGSYKQRHGYKMNMRDVS